MGWDGEPKPRGTQRAKVEGEKASEHRRRGSEMRPRGPLPELNPANWNRWTLARECFWIVNDWREGACSVQVAWHAIETGATQTTQGCPSFDA